MAVAVAGCPNPDLSGKSVTEDIAQEWMNLTLDALLPANLGPPPEARILWHVAAAMYEGWAAYDPVATGYLTGHRYKQPPEKRTLANRAETISHAVYVVLQDRFEFLADKGDAGQTAFEAFTEKMQLHEYIDENGAIVESEAQALGTLLGQLLLDYFENDNANEEGGYVDNITGYEPINPPLVANQSGTNGVIDPNLWQEIITPDGVQQTFLGSQWRHVTPFALRDYIPNQPRYNPPPPPLLGTDSEQEFIDQMVDVIKIVASMDPASGFGAEMVNLSPRVRGLETPFITSESVGHAINPYTQEPYEDHMVPMGDYLRVNAVYHDGPRFRTPGPWWTEMTGHVLAGEEIVDQPPANKANVHDLGYDVKLYFALTGAIHDAAIVVREIKLVWETCRPITGIRYLAETKQLPIVPGLIEFIEAGDPLAGDNEEFVGEQKVLCWAGPNLGVEWIRGVNWLPYQEEDSVSPPFSGYTSGHTTYSSAGAEILKLYTGDPYFPGGIAKVQVDALRFEDDMTAPMALQWATYKDAADEVGFGRVCTGAHIYADVDFARPIGTDVAQKAYDLAMDYFEGRGVAVSKNLP